MNYIQLHSIAFPLISAGIFGGSLDNPPAESVKQCLKAYHKITQEYNGYDIDVLLCAFSQKEMLEAEKIFHSYRGESGYEI